MENSKNQETSKQIKERVLKCREIQLQRYKDTNIFLNSNLTIPLIEKHCKLGMQENLLLQKCFNSMNLSARAYHKILKVARTIADLKGIENIDFMCLSEAIQYRSLDRKYWA